MNFKINEISTARLSNEDTVLKVTSLQTGLTFSVKIQNSILEDVDTIKTILKRRHDDILDSKLSVDCEIKVGNII